MESQKKKPPIGEFKCNRRVRFVAVDELGRWYSVTGTVHGWSMPMASENTLTVKVSLRKATVVVDDSP